MFRQVKCGPFSRCLTIKLNVWVRIKWFYFSGGKGKTLICFFQFGLKLVCTGLFLVDCEKLTNEKFSCSVKICNAWKLCPDLWFMIRDSQEGWVIFSHRDRTDARVCRLWGYSGWWAQLAFNFAAPNWNPGMKSVLWKITRGHYNATTSPLKCHSKTFKSSSSGWMTRLELCFRNGILFVADCVWSLREETK